MKDKTVGNLMDQILYELETSREFIKGKFENREKHEKDDEKNGEKDGESQHLLEVEPREVYKKYKSVLTAIDKKIKFYKNVNDELMNAKNENGIKDKCEKNNENGKCDKSSTDSKISASRKGNFFEEYEKYKRRLHKMKKKTIAGYTTEGNAIIINNEKFSKLFMNYNFIRDRKNGTKDMRHHFSHHNGKTNEDDENEVSGIDRMTHCNDINDQTGMPDLSEQSCSSSSIVSLHSFIKREKIKRIKKNREEYVKHKYHDNAYVIHKLYSCSDCSSSSFSWYSDEYDDLFYYSNLLKEDKQLRKHALKFNRRNGETSEVEKYVHNQVSQSEGSEGCNEKHSENKREKKGETEGEKKNRENKDKKEGQGQTKMDLDKIAEESPFYNHIYFKYAETDKRKLYPVFINIINGKKKLCNLKKISRHKYKKSYEPEEVNKYELDNALFSYKNTKHLPSVEYETKKKGNQIMEVQNVEMFKKKHFDSDEFNYSIDKIMHQLEKISSSEKEGNKKFNHSDHFNNFIKKNKEYLKRENNFSLQKLCQVEKIRLKVKIIGTDGKEIKNKSLDNVLINKNKTFGDLASRLGNSFKLPNDKIEKIKIYFDGDLCDKDLTFDNEELGLEDGYQIDVKFPLTDDIANKHDEESFSDDNYVLILPDSYVID
ncbi:hypothetical protein, conserved [Plasmodium gonderi]|uniref:Uncharacterized protein n=1 Tax=Plasmodium gonderi TaxID=77519 RepID=A0A1Y1JSH3_PLAGO|nr:hypothetical protein, conserved [Plasmodium gonderi]GAW83383.1 hypothetical protein, conserved [Plasmodium gonderi]